jgi:DNA-binding CsgD family transcriptional regulator
MMEVAEKHYDELVGLIYESAHDPALLIPVMKEICSRIGAVAGHFVKMDVSTGFVSTSLITDVEYAKGDQEYASYYAQIDPRLSWLEAGGIGEWQTDQERFDNRFVARSEFYNDFLHRYDVRHIVGTYIGEQMAQKETIGFLRPLGASKYTKEEFDFLQRLSPHLIRASTFRSKLEQLSLQHERDQVTLSQLTYGTAWIDNESKIVVMNDIARRLLATGDGISVINGRLHAYEPEEKTMLDSAMKAATASHRRTGHWMMVRRRKTKFPLLISVVPAPPPSEMYASHHTAALVLFQDLGHQRIPQAQLLQQAFRLTLAEARLAEALLHDETLQSYADKNRLSRNTIRTHLVNLFAKTGARRQAELIKILLAIIPPVNFPLNM